MAQYFFHFYNRNVRTNHLLQKKITFKKHYKFQHHLGCLGKRDLSILKSLTMSDKETKLRGSILTF